MTLKKSKYYDIIKGKHDKGGENWKLILVICRIL